jgi:deoxyhypusine synthase
MDKIKPVDLSKIKTLSITKRKNKVKIPLFASVSEPGTSFGEFLDSLPKILKAVDFNQLVKTTVKAKKENKHIVWAMGDSIIKCGLSPLIIHMMKKGFISAIALQGAGIIHDAEISLIGETSEDVAVTIEDGSFGMAEETGTILNEAIIEGVKDGLGIGEAVGRKLNALNVPHKDKSIVACAYELNIPVTVHIAMGTDIIHMHPKADGAALGKGTHIDFTKFAAIVSELSSGVILNIGSAVILPEVFLKALSVARNLGNKVAGFTTANFDMIQHYRPLENVVKRPVSTGGQGFAITGHHEIMIPLFVRALLEADGK